MRWYGFRMERIKTWVREYDDEVATDTALYIRDSIALKNLQIKGKYKSYYLRAYRNRLLAVKMKQRHDLDIDDVDVAAPEYDYEHLEETIAELNNQMIEYVRAKYHPRDASLFEMYIGLQPHMSYARLAKFLGWGAHKVWVPLGIIRRDLKEKFAEQHEYLLSLS